MFPFQRKPTESPPPRRWSSWVGQWGDQRWSLGHHRVLLLTARQFEREVARERVRSMRRSIPFCVLTIELIHGSASTGLRRQQSRRLVKLLHHNLRMTDEKALLSLSQLAVLLVDTPEMGGRAVIDRVAQLTSDAGLPVKLSLQVHDPDGFGDRDDDRPGWPSDRRRDDPAIESWVRTSPPHPVSRQSVDAVAPLELSVGDERLGSSPAPAVMTIKRVVDVVGSGIGLMLAGPAIVVAVAAIRWNDGGPAFFCQTREGRFGRPFTIYKLRTMVVDAERTQSELADKNHRDGPAFKLRNDPRVTPVGRFLRATCLDELPQLINVLKGDMSLVGPRPLPWHESRSCNRWHRRRLDVRPGLTCSWQIDKAKAPTFDDWMRMDLRYVDRIGLLQDLYLIARTVMVPVTGRGGE